MKFRSPLFFALALLCAAFSFVPSGFAMSDREVTRAYYGCLRFLKLSPANQAVVARKAGYSLKQTRWACRLMARNGLRRSIELEHEYERGGTYAPSRPEPAEPSQSSDLSSGTCYYMHGCSGNSVHVGEKIHCPSGYDSFKPDFGGYGCENLH